MATVCDKLEYNAFQTDDNIVRLKNMQIINGGQTCKTIHETLKSSPGTNVASAYVMIRIYQLVEDSRDFIQDITYATNSQNPVDLRDLRSNDELQKTLELGMKGLGYVYKRQREEGVTGPNVITSAVAAEAVLAVWRERPHQAKFRRSEHFGKLYNDIFVGLDPAQAVVATLIFRGVENRRKRPAEETPPPFIVVHGGLHDARTGSADAGDVGQRNVGGLAGEILLHRHQAGHAPACDILAAPKGPGHTVRSQYQIGRASCRERV